MKKINLAFMSLLAVSLLASCGSSKPDPTPDPTYYTLTLNLTHCNVGGESTYVHTYAKGSMIDPVIVSPDDGFSLNDNSISSKYKVYWKESDAGTYIFSGLSMDENYNISIGSSFKVTIESKTESESVTIDPSAATPNKKYTGTITINTGNRALAEKLLVSVVLDDGTSIIGDCKCSLKLGRKTAQITIPAKDVTSNIKIIVKTVDESSLWFKQTEWWNYCSNDKEDQQAILADVGQKVEWTVNGQIHKVRLIDIDKDVDQNGNKIHTTFEFANLVSDSNGDSLATVWNDTDERNTANYDYLNSTIRKALNGTGDADHFLWTQKGQTIWTDDYENKTVYDMLNEGNSNLMAKLKSPSKLISIYNVQSTEEDKWEEKTVNDKLFLLSPRELGNTSERQEPSTFTYSYYQDHSEISDPIRIKTPVNEGGTISDDITIPYVEASGQLYKGGVSNRSSYNFNGESGVAYLLRSPFLNDSNNNCWCTDYSGLTTARRAFNSASGLAPGFCI